MHRALRIVLLAVASAVALAFSSTALAVYTPSLSVTHALTTPGAASGATAIHIKSSTADDPTAKLQIFVPADYTIDVSKAAGTTIGTVKATAQGGPEVGGITVPLSGTVSVDNPANHTTDACSPGTHLAVWNLNLSIAGTTSLAPIPVYVDNTPTAFSAFGGHVISVCLPPPDVPVGTPGRSAQGAKVLDATFAVTGIFTNPSSAGEYIWTGLYTPYVPTRGVPNQAGTVQSRAFVRIPARVTLTAKVKRGKSKSVVTLSGALREFTNGVGGVTVSIQRGASTRALVGIGSVKTKSNGSWSRSISVKPRKAVYFRVRATIPERDYTAQGCIGAPATIPCVSATLAGPVAVTSVILKVKP